MVDTKDMNMIHTKTGDNPEGTATEPLGPKQKWHQTIK